MDDRELRELCRPFEVLDVRALGSIIDEFGEENPDMLDDLGTVAHGICDFMRARGAGGPSSGILTTSTRT